MLDEILFLPRLIGRAAAEAVTEAWGWLMTCLFWPGEKLGLWKLRKATEAKGAPHMTRKLAHLIQWTALAAQAGILAVGGLKLYWLWLAGR